jgi:hypothetical protein
MTDAEHDSVRQLCDEILKQPTCLRQSPFTHAQAKLKSKSNLAMQSAFCFYVAGKTRLCDLVDLRISQAMLLV